MFSDRQFQVRRKGRRRWVFATARGRGTELFLPKTSEILPADPDQQKTQRRLLQLLRDLKDSTTNEDDSLSVHVHTSDDALNATIKCDTGILRFFGKQIARFSKVNFQ